MYSHIMLGANDLDASKTFYDAIFSVLGYPEGALDPTGRVFYMNEAGVFALTKPIDGEPATHGNGSTIGFHISSPELVDAWHKAGVENGGISCEDPPGFRDIPGQKMYLAYLRDPAGNKLCGTHIPS